jgi:hypothetical protein
MDNEIYQLMFQYLSDYRSVFLFCAGIYFAGSISGYVTDFLWWLQGVLFDDRNYN